MSTAPVDIDAYRREIEAWREERYARLRQPLSWLTLAGLEWLREGENRVGTAADVELRLPSGPAVAGRLVRTGVDVVAHGEPGAGLRHEGREVDGLRLVADADAPDGEGPTLLELGALRMCTIRRGERIGLRVWDTGSAALRSFEGIPHYAVDPDWRIVARVEPTNESETILVPDVLGGAERERVLARVAFEVGGRTHRLTAIEGDEGRLWFLFADQTNGDATYGGGRFVYADSATSDGSVTVDFNRAYNPPCVFSPYATCPLPPPVNRLALRVEAGEKSLTVRAPRHARARG